MSLSGFLPVVSRRAMVIGGVAALASAVSIATLHAQGTQQQQQTTPPQTAAPQTPAQPAPADPLTFTTTGPRVVILTVTQDAGQAFEAALNKAKDVLAKSTKPEQKQQAAHWKVLKGAQADNIVFIFTLDQTSANMSYNPFVILQGAGLDQAVYASDITPLFNRVNAGLKGLLAIEGTLIDMGGAPAGGAH